MKQRKRVDESNISEFIGQKFFSLTILDYVQRKDKKEPLKVKCLCDCGNECVKVFEKVRSGHTKSCGCRITVRKTEKDYSEFIGKKYNRLTILEYIGRAEDGHALVKCLCECGNIRINTIKDVTNGYVKSCGCLQKEITKKRVEIDGRIKEKLYTTYASMKAHCYNEKNNNYKNYGKRGIKICDEWLEDYSNFRSWALSNGYKDELSIDRIDVNGNYEPNNCRWATREEQNNNKRNTIYLTYNGETHNITEWAKIIGINRKVISSRYYSKLPIEKILYPDNLSNFNKGEKR